MIDNNVVYNYFYKITNNINNKFYYGVHCTNNLNDGYFGSGHRLKLAIKQYGKENFKKEILKFFDSREQCSEYESLVVNENCVFDIDCYNLKRGGDYGTTIGTILTVDENGVWQRCKYDDDKYINGTLKPFSTGKVTAYDIKENKYKLISIEEYKKEKDVRYIHSTKDTVLVKNNEGQIFRISLNDERFLKAKKSDQEYFKRLLERIKLIRTSERMFYQKITDIFAECSIDYDKNSDTAITFYKTIQNKFHYAITGNTAAEIVYNRADSEKENMGLTTWENSPNGKILKSDVIIAKNYLNEQEIKNLNNLVNLFLDIAENNAERSITMYMEDWKNEVENALKVFHYEVLEGKGKISHKQAITKAENEYEKYKVSQDKNYVSDFDKLLNETKQIENK